VAIVSTVNLMSWASRLRRASPLTVELAVAAAVAFPTAMDAWWNEAGSRQADGLTYALTVVSIGALLFRRRLPFATALVCGGALTGWYVLGHHGELLNLPTMVALYTIAVQGDRRTTVLTGAVGSVWSGILGFTSSDPIGARGGSPVLEMLWPLVPLALGEAARARRELVASAEAEREREARRRVEAERVRIAQEFHDLVAHTMAAVNVQMGVAVAAFDSQPDTARDALARARASSKEALLELRATVALLRDPDGTHATRPAPQLTEIDELADVARAAGINVTVEADMVDADLPGAVGLAAYRIVQEALTNVVRHSDAGNVAVSVRHEPGGLVVEVIDDGTTGAASSAGTNGAGGATPGPAGHGLIGMSERAAAVGGRLEHGRTGEGGFRIHALLPTGAGTGPS
jgi:signal transduction histidine kinase